MMMNYVCNIVYQPCKVVVCLSHHLLRVPHVLSLLHTMSVVNQSCHHYPKKSLLHHHHIITRGAESGRQSGLTTLCRHNMYACSAYCIKVHLQVPLYCRIFILPTLVYTRTHTRTCTCTCTRTRTRTHTHTDS